MLIVQYVVGIGAFLSAAVAFGPPTFGTRSGPRTSQSTVLYAAPEKDSITPTTSKAFSLTLTKPLGLMLEEIQDGVGVMVQDVTAEGSAASYAEQVRGARVVRINAQNVQTAPFDQVMELIAACDGTVTLEFLPPKTPLPIGTPVTIAVVMKDATRELPAKVGDNLRQTLLNNNIDVYAGMQKITNCGGAGQCTLCAFDVLAEDGDWDERSEYENSRLKSFPKARLTCLNVIQGPATIQKTKR